VGYDSLFESIVLDIAGFVNMPTLGKQAFHLHLYTYHIIVLIKVLVARDFPC